MVTTPFSSVLEGICDLIGIGADELMDVDAQRLRRLASRRLRRIWTHRFWPDTMGTVVEHHFRPAFDPVAVYLQGDVIWHPETNGYWLRADNTSGLFTPGAGHEWAPAKRSYAGNYFATGAIAAGTTFYYPADGEFYFAWKTTTGAELPTDPDYFVRLTPFEAYILTDDTMGLIKALTDRHPNYRDAQPVPYALGAGRIIVLGNALSAWVAYQLPAPVLVGDPYSATLAYAAGSQVYFAGNYWRSNAATTAGQSPTTHAALWDLQTIPLEFSQYLEQGTYADWLPSDGNPDQRHTENGLAELYLQEAVMRLIGTQANNNQTEVLLR